MSKESILALLDKSPYALETIEPLEAYVTSTDNYDFDIQHALLKLYQFHPSKTNKTCVSKILLSAMTRIPDSDFISHLYIIPESLQTNDAKFSAIVSSYDNLEKAQFKEFWTQISTLEVPIAGFHDTIRNIICEMIKKSYRTIKLSTFAEFVHLSSPQDLQNFLTKLEPNGWKVSGELLHTPNDVGATKPKSTNIEFESFAKLFSNLR